jgi:hypothetical protein
MKGAVKGGIYHEFFRKGQQELCHYMTRCKIKGQASMAMHTSRLPLTDEPSRSIAAMIASGSCSTASLQQLQQFLIIGRPSQQHGIDRPQLGDHVVSNSRAELMPAPDHLSRECCDRLLFARQLNDLNNARTTTTNSVVNSLRLESYLLAQSAPPAPELTSRELRHLLLEKRTTIATRRQNEN